MYNDNEKALIWLNNYANISARKKHELIDCFNSPSELYKEFINEKELISDVIGIKNYNILYSFYDDGLLDKIIYEYSHKKIQIITYCSDAYPDKLKNIFDPPIVLYCRGNTELLSGKVFAVVGTRRITRYGIDVTHKFTEELVYQGFAIISGLARGVDSYAHKTALECDGNTIAVLGSGIDIVYPAENKDLAINIAEKGLVLSEYPLGTPPHPYNFPNRNRIISGLSDGVLVPEAGLKSGSMITANNALEQGKDIFVIPGNIFSEASKGTNELIKNYKDIVMVTNINDILSHYNIKCRERNISSMQLDFIEQSIINELNGGECHFEELLVKSNIEVNKLTSVLTGLEIMGLIRKLPGNFYCIIDK